MPTHPHSLQMTALSQRLFTYDSVRYLKMFSGRIKSSNPSPFTDSVYVKMMEPESIKTGKDFRGETKALMLEVTGSTQ